MATRETLTEYDINIRTLGADRASRTLQSFEKNAQNFGKTTERSFGRAGLLAQNLGQAFEDGAIGFQLNGMAGAARGAGNNISFMLASLGGVQGALAGAAISVGALFLPKLLGMERQAVDTKGAVDALSGALDAIQKRANIALRIRVDQQGFERALSGLGNQEQGQDLLDKLNSELDAEREKLRAFQLRRQALRNDIAKTRERILIDLIRSLETQQPRGFEDQIALLQRVQQDPARFADIPGIIAQNAVVLDEFANTRITTENAALREFIKTLREINSVASKAEINALEDRIGDVTDALKGLDSEANIDAKLKLETAQRRLRVLNGDISSLQARIEELTALGVSDPIAFRVAQTEQDINEQQQENDAAKRRREEAKNAAQQIEKATASPVGRLIDEFANIEAAQAAGSITNDVAARAQQLSAARYQDAVKQLDRQQAGASPQRLGLQQLGRQIQNAALARDEKTVSNILQAQKKQQHEDAEANKVILKQISTKVGKPLQAT